MKKKELIELIKEQTVQIKKLEQEVESLKASLAKNSSNSSKPPSSDIYATKKPKSLRPLISKKKVGGQKGHKGHTLNFSESPDKVHYCRVNQCERCNHNLEKIQGSIEKRQVYEIPQPRIEVSEFQIEKSNVLSADIQLKQ